MAGGTEPRRLRARAPGAQARAPRPAGRRGVRRRAPGPIIVGVAAGAGVVGLVLAMAYRVFMASVGTGPQVGDHWHAPFQVVVCGQRVGPLPPSPGDVHTHGDDVIHIHPARPTTGGAHANLKAFFASATVNVTPTVLAVGGRTFRNGDACPDGRAGTATVLVNGRPRTDFEAYVPRDGDRIEFRFGP